MANLYHDWGGDLVQAADGGLLLADGGDESRQRVLRRLLTNPGDYIWHIKTAIAAAYGAGLPGMVGQPIDVKAVQGLVLAQMFLEQGVARSPRPVVTVSAIPNGIFVNIRYWDSSTNAPVTLAFDVDI
jgi:hypothetical protein